MGSTRRSCVGRGRLPEWSVKENVHAGAGDSYGEHDESPPLLESLVVFGKARSLDRVRRFVDAQKKMRR